MAQNSGRLDRISRRIRLRDLHVFAAVAKAGSMSRAASQLGVTQPTVSQHIADLETAISQPLLNRGQTGVAPTAYGEALLRHTAEAFDALSQGLREIDFLADGTSGEVRVGASESYIAGGFLAAGIDRVRQHHPRLVIRVAEANTAALDFNGLRDRSLDIILGRMPAAASCEDIETEVLYHEAIVPVVGVQSCWARAADLTLRDLAAAPWLLAPPGTAVCTMVEDAFRAEGLAPPAAPMTTYSMQLRMQLLTRGDYVSSLPASLLSTNGQRWGLRALPIPLGRPLPVAVATLRRRNIGSAPRLFLDHLRAATAEARATAADPQV